MAVQQSQVLPAQFVQDLGQDLAKQVTAQSGVPVVSTGIAGISQQAGESADDFAARQQAAREFTTRQQSLSGLAPQVAGQDALQTQAQTLAQQGVGSFQPFLNQAQTQATLASGLGTQALGQLGTAGTTLGGVPLGAQAFQQGVSDFASPYQAQVIQASLDEFDRNKQIQEQRIRDQAVASGAFGGGREGVQLAEFGSGMSRERAGLQAGLQQQGFQAAQAAMPKSPLPYDKSQDESNISTEDQEATDSQENEDEQTEESSEEDEITGDDFENLYKGEISKSGAPILPSKRARKIPEKIQTVTKDEIDTSEEISSETILENDDQVSLEDLKEQENLEDEIAEEENKN